MEDKTNWILIIGISIGVTFGLTALFWFTMSTGACNPYDKSLINSRYCYLYWQRAYFCLAASGIFTACAALSYRR